MKPQLVRRIEALQAEMERCGLDAVVFADRENCIYYLGATDIECAAVVVPATGEPLICCLWLDAPYVSACTGVSGLLAYRYPESSLAATIVQALRQLGGGALRVGFHKYFVEFSIFDALRTAFPGMEFHPAMELTYRVRSVKDADELALIAQACAFVDIGMEAAVEALRPGLTEVQVLAEAEYAMRKAGSEGATFRMQVLNHGKQLLAHPYASQDVITGDQPVVIHLGASCRGYAAKMCRTVMLGRVQDETLHIYDALLTAQDKAVAALVPGRTAAQIYDVVDASLSAQGYGGLFLDHLGYGVGIRQSEFYPILGKNIGHVLERDMVVDLLLPTIFKRGAGGPRVTDMVHVTETGGRYMTAFRRGCIMKI